MAVPSMLKKMSKSKIKVNYRFGGLWLTKQNGFMVHMDIMQKQGETYVYHPSPKAI